MDDRTMAEPAPMANLTTTERTSDREMVVKRSFDGPARIVFSAWTQPETFRRWWTPKSMGITVVSCDLDVRTGGTYRLVLRHPAFEQPMAFFGRYIDVVAHSRIVWTNEESGDAGQVTTVTFEERGATTMVVVHDLYPSKEALDAAIAEGSTGAFAEQFEALDEVLTTLA